MIAIYVETGPGEIKKDLMKTRIKNINPVFYERTHEGESFYDVYARLIKDRIIFLTEDITSENASVIASLLLLLNTENSDEPISFYINSPGGQVEAFFAIYDMMQLINAPIKTVGIGEASSAAAILLAAGTKGMRYATQNCNVMIHQIQIMGHSEGSGTDVENEAKEIKRIKKRLTETLARHVGKSYRKVFNDCEIDKYMSAGEALEYGIVDGIIQPKKAIPELIKGRNIAGKKINESA